jgi:hypothetical protein
MAIRPSCPSRLSVADFTGLCLLCYHFTPLLYRVWKRDDWPADLEALLPSTFAPRPDY